MGAGGDGCKRCGNGRGWTETRLRADLYVIINTHQENVFFDLRANASWYSELLLLCYLGAGWPYVIVAANVPVQRELYTVSQKNKTPNSWP